MSSKLTDDRSGVRSAKTVAGYRSLLDTIVLPRWKDTALREMRFDDLQVWISTLSVEGSVRFEGKGLSASRVRQAHQLVGAVLRFAVKAKHLAVNPAEGADLPTIPETEQRYMTHEQLHRVAVASGRLRTLVLVIGYCGLRFGEASALQVSDVDIEGRRIAVRRSVTYVRKTGSSRGRRRITPAGRSGAGVRGADAEDRDRRPRQDGVGVPLCAGRWLPDPRASAVHLPEGNGGRRGMRRGAAPRSEALLRFSGDQVRSEYQGGAEALGPQVGGPNAGSLRTSIPGRSRRGGVRIRRGGGICCGRTADALRTGTPLTTIRPGENRA